MFVVVFFPMTLFIAMAIYSGGSAIAENGGGPAPPLLGDWNVTSDTILEGGHFNVTGDIRVEPDAHLWILNSTIRVVKSHSDEYTMWVMAGASLDASNSTLVLDKFQAEFGSSLSFHKGTIVMTTGRFIGSSNSFFAEDTTFNNVASSGGPGQAGEDAIFIADGKVNSEFINVHIKNHAGNAGDTIPGADGAIGGMSLFISNVSAWTDSSIECVAGNSRGGGLGLTGSSGGDGGLGGDVEIRMRTSYLENVVIYAKASDGGIGARGASNPSGTGGNGGDGADGGNALMMLESLKILEMNNVSITTISGNGGSGGNGGEAIDGDGGTAGDGADAGFSNIEISCIDDIIMEETRLDAM
jgi:hypothetical protein